MNSDTDIIMNKSAIQFICGDNANVCRLCLNSSDANEIKIVSIHELAVIKTSYYNGEISYLSIFNELGVSPEQHLPEVICINCATLTVNSYLFQKICEYSQQQWHTSLQSIDNTITQSESLNSRAGSVYFFIGNNEDSMLTCYNQISEKNRRNVLAKLQKNMQIRLKRRHEKGTIQKKFLCPSCPKIFSKAYELEDHREKIHYPKTIACDLCPKMVSTNKQLSKHKKRNHINFTCQVCNLELTSKHTVRSHMEGHKRKLSAKPSHTLHIDTRPDRNSCPRCNKEFMNRKSYEFHVKNCGEFICDICSREYTHRSSLIAHIDRIHGQGLGKNNIISCKWCNKNFTSVSGLKQHEVKHTGERKFTCEICGGKFVTNPALVYHMRLHTGERPYPCDMCNERFLNSSRRQAHKRKVHFGPQEECDVCHAKFFLRNVLMKHKRCHENPNSKLYAAKILLSS